MHSTSPVIPYFLIEMIIFTDYIWFSEIDFKNYDGKISLSAGMYIYNSRNIVHSILHTNDFVWLTFLFFSFLKERCRIISVQYQNICNDIHLFSINVLLISTEYLMCWPYCNSKIEKQKQHFTKRLRNLENGQPTQLNLSFWHHSYLFPHCFVRQQQNNWHSSLKRNYSLF